MITALAINATLAAIVLIALLAVIVREIRAGASPARAAAPARPGRLLTLPRRTESASAPADLVARRAA